MIWFIIGFGLLIWFVTWLHYDGDSIGMVIFVGVLAAFMIGWVVVFIPHMVVNSIDKDPHYLDTVSLQEVNGYYITENAENYIAVYGDDRSFESVTLTKGEPLPTEGCESGTAKRYETYSDNWFWSVIPISMSTQYIICVPDGGINKVGD